jgi:hypothetical protein
VSVCVCVCVRRRVHPASVCSLSVLACARARQIATIANEEFCTRWWTWRSEHAAHKSAIFSRCRWLAAAMVGVVPTPCVCLLRWIWRIWRRVRDGGCILVAAQVARLRLATGPYDVMLIVNTCVTFHVINQSRVPMNHFVKGVSRRAYMQRYSRQHPSQVLCELCCVSGGGWVGGWFLRMPQTSCALCAPPSERRVTAPSRRAALPPSDESPASRIACSSATAGACPRAAACHNLCEQHSAR